MMMSHRYYLIKEKDVKSVLNLGVSVRQGGFMLFDPFMYLLKINIYSSQLSPFSLIAHKLLSQMLFVYVGHMPKGSCDYHQ
jgi:hypothetical protein